MAVNFVERIDDRVKIEHVLISVSDKSGLESFVPGLLEINPALKVYSTGGTFDSLGKILGARWKANLISVSDYTGQPEMQGGLVKTLDFKIYLGLLSETYNEAHGLDLKRVGGVAFDMVVVNLYPFRQTVAKPDATPEMARANIDIGGPCMVRAAAKNFLRVAAVTDPADYPRILEALKKGAGAAGLGLRYELARKAFSHTAQYDAAISAYLTATALDSVAGSYKIEKR